MAEDGGGESGYTGVPGQDSGGGEGGGEARERRKKLLQAMLQANPGMTEDGGPASGGAIDGGGATPGASATGASLLGPTLRGGERTLDPAMAERRQKLLNYLAGADQFAAKRFGTISGSNDKLSDYNANTGERNTGTTIYPNLPMEGKLMGETDLFKNSPVGKALLAEMANLGVEGVDLDKTAWTSGAYRTGLAKLLGMPSQIRSGGRLRMSTPATSEMKSTLMRWPGRIRV